MSSRRFFVLLGGILNFVGLGYYYSIGSLLPSITMHLKRHGHINSSVETNWFPTLILVIAAVVMPLSGILERRTIFRAPLLLSALFCSIGVLSSHLSIKCGYAFFVVTYCVMYGIGLGMNYSITPYVVLQWYPNNESLVCGSVFAGLGVGSILFSQIQSCIVKQQKCHGNSTNCEDPNKVPSVFMIDGSVIFALQIMGTMIMRKKETNKFNRMEVTSVEDITIQEDISVDVEVSPRDLVRRRGFYVIWVVMLLECFPTTTFLSFSKVLGLATVKDKLFVRIVEESSAAFLLLGFIIWSVLVEKISYKIPLQTVIICWVIGLLAAPECLKLQPIKFFYASFVFLSTLCITGYRVLLYVATAKAFGVSYLCINYALVNTASIFGGVACILFTIYFPMKRIDAVLYICAAINAAAFLVWLMMPDDRKVCNCRLSKESMDEELNDIEVDETSSNHSQQS